LPRRVHVVAVHQKSLPLHQQSVGLPEGRLRQFSARGGTLRKAYVVATGTIASVGAIGSHWTPTAAQRERDCYFSRCAGHTTPRACLVAMPPCPRAELGH
jgi:hypothetical protein